jgi:integrase
MTQVASIHKDPRGKSPFWYCAYRLPNGKRAFKSTKQRSRAKAEEFCAAIDKAAKLGAKGNLTEDRARVLISEIVEQTTGEPLRFYSVEEWLTEWLSGKKSAKAEGTHTKYKATIDRFIGSLGERSKRGLGHMAPRDVQRFCDSEKDRGLHPSTRNSAVKHLRMAFTAARRQGLITTNPAEAIEMLPTDPDSARRPFDLEHVTALIKTARGDWRGVVIVALYTAARLKDVVNMRWEHIDLQKKWISFRAKKRKQWINIPMHDALYDYLLELPAPDNGKAFLFPSLAGKSTGGKSGLSMAFQRIMEKAGVVAEVVRARTGKSGRAVNSLSFHSLRHTLNSLMANAGVPVEVRQKFTGHASAEMNARYTHHEIETLRAAIGRIPSIELP